MSAPAYATRRRAALALGGAAFVAAHWAVILHRRALAPGDFDLSRELGRRFLAGEPLYAGGLHYPYMPAAALSFAPFALLPPTLGLALRYALALACLWWVLRVYTTLAGAAAPAARGAVTGLSLLLAAHYLIRDLDDGGPHIILLAIAVAGIDAAARGRQGLAAAAFGCAMAMKAPYALFLPYLLWTRRWRLSALSAVAAALWIAAPALWMGTASWWNHQAQWTRTAFASARGAPAPLARDSEARLQNQALRPVVERLAAARLGGGAPRLFAAAAAALLVAFCAAWARPRRDRAAAARWPRECAAVLLLTALLSPVTWVQHLVVALPALVLLVADAVAAPERRWRRAPLAVFAILALLLNRELLGRADYVALLGLGLHTWAILLLLAALCARAPRAGGAAPP